MANAVRKASFFYHGSSGAEPLPVPGEELRGERRMTMFKFIIFILVLSVIGSIFSRPHYGYYRRPRIYPFGGFGYRGWGMGPH